MYVVCLSVCLSVSLVVCVKTAERIDWADKAYVSDLSESKKKVKSICIAPYIRKLISKALR